MMKNVIDCLMGGISYWAIGHGLTVGGVNICGDDDDDDADDGNDGDDGQSHGHWVCVGLTSVFPSILEYWMMICLARHTGILQNQIVGILEYWMVIGLPRNTGILDDDMFAQEYWNTG